MTLEQILIFEQKVISAKTGEEITMKKPVGTPFAIHTGGKTSEEPNLDLILGKAEEHSLVGANAYSIRTEVLWMSNQHAKISSVQLYEI